MKKWVLCKRFFIIGYILLLFPQITLGETSPFALKVSLLKDHIPAGELIPVLVALTVAPNHHVYKDQVKVESGDPARFTVVSTELPAGKIKYDQFLEKEVENYEGQIEIKSFVQLPKDTSAGIQGIKLRVHYQGCSDKICFPPKVEEFVLPVQVEAVDWKVAVSRSDEKPQKPGTKSEKKSEISGFQKTIESRGIFVSLILIFLAGVGLSFTPCVYPMIPITVAVIGGQATGEQGAAKKPLTAFFSFSGLCPWYIVSLFYHGCGSRFYGGIIWFRLAESVGCRVCSDSFYRACHEYVWSLLLAGTIVYL